ncbi:hypothetical protein L1987_14969 [Smallanthus sonchifolius]|uniref:Uncharacterized protein n=1 Tax=Smallanthus sonchifolius TaxID=185202 RepID=A0ACB9J6F5_9ASTR|nr:hypothetical protein L1987_14969 [Smallanthus sonchifolius]
MGLKLQVRVSGNSSDHSNHYQNLKGLRHLAIFKSLHINSHFPISAPNSISGGSMGFDQHRIRLEKQKGGLRQSSFYGSISYGVARRRSKMFEPN